jgi:cytochrome P450
VEKLMAYANNKQVPQKTLNKEDTGVSPALGNSPGKPVPAMASPSEVSSDPSYRKAIGRLRVSFLLSDVDMILNKLAEAFQKHDVVQVKADIPVKLFCFWRPQHILKLYTQRSTAIAKPPRNMMEREEWLMEGELVTDTGQDWKRKKNMLGPQFHKFKAQDLCHALPPGVERMLLRFAQQLEGKPIDIFWEMRRLITDVSFEMFFSELIGDRLDRVTRAIEFSEEMFPVQFPPFFVPTAANLRFRREGKYLKQVLQEIMAKRKTDSSPKPDFLSYLRNTVDSEIHRKWNEDEIAKEMFIFMGTPAVAVALGWGFYLLAQHPSITRNLQEVLRNAFKNGTPSIQTLDEIPQLEWVVNEIMRLYPPFWGSVRFSATEVEMDGYRFPAGSTFLPIRFFSQRSPEYWDHPLAFDPDRFANASKASQKNNPANLLPFGAGPRTCLGIHLAPLICKYVIAAVLNRYSLEYSSQKPNGLALSRFSFGLYPREPIFLTLSPKTAI